MAEGTRAPGECLTIDFHATLIYSSAPPSRVFRARGARAGSLRSSSSRWSRPVSLLLLILLLLPSFVSSFSSLVTLSEASPPPSLSPSSSTRGRFMDFQGDSSEIGPRDPRFLDAGSRDCESGRDRRAIKRGWDFSDQSGRRDRGSSGQLRIVSGELWRYY